MEETIVAAAARPAAMADGTGGLPDTAPGGPAPREETLTMNQGENKL